MYVVLYRSQWVREKIGRFFLWTKEMQLNWFRISKWQRKCFLDRQLEHNGGAGNAGESQNYEKSLGDGLNGLCKSNLLPKLIHITASWNESLPFCSSYALFRWSCSIHCILYNMRVALYVLCFSIGCRTCASEFYSAFVIIIIIDATNDDEFTPFVYWKHEKLYSHCGQKHSQFPCVWTRMTLVGSIWLLFGYYYFLCRSQLNICAIFFEILGFQTYSGTLTNTHTLAPMSIFKPEHNVAEVIWLMRMVL